METDGMLVEPYHVLAGLGYADRKTICTLLALYDANLPALLWEQCATAMKNFKGVGAMVMHIVPESVAEHPARTLEQRLEASADKLLHSASTDAQLMLRLWMNLRHGFGLDPALAFSFNDAAGITDDLGDAVCCAYAEQQENRAAKEKSLFSREYWIKHGNQRFNPFAGKKAHNLNFHDVVQRALIEMVSSAAARGELPEAMQSEVMQDMQKLVESLAPDQRDQIMKDLGVDTLNADLAIRILNSRKTSVGIAMTIEFADLFMYLLTTRASTLLPLLGGNMLASTLAFLANPVFMIPALLGGSVAMSASMRSKICRVFGVSVAVILAVRAIAEEKYQSSPIVDIFEDLPEHMPIEFVSAYRSAGYQASNQGWQLRVSERIGSAKKWALDKTIGTDFPDAEGYLGLYYRLKGT